MITISLCMIVKNEEDTLERCIESVKGVVDEIVIVDTGSTDKTREIAKRLTRKFYDFKWIDSFSAARNFSYSKATKDYIMILDADDVLMEEDREKFKKLKETLNPETDVVMMQYNAGFDENGKVTLQYYRERLSKRSRNFQWIEPVHEHLVYYGKIEYSEVAISHKKIHPTEAGRNLRIYQKLVAEGKPLSPRGMYYYARELYYIANYEEAIKEFNAFLDTELGWIEDNIQACFLISKCYMFLKDEKNRLKVLYRSFEYDVPRPEICCDLGYIYKLLGDFIRAKYWFLRALEYKPTGQSLGFVIRDYSEYIPAIELCVCCDKLGDREEAIRYNEIAGAFKPGNSAVQYNRKYFGLIKDES